MDVSIVSCIMNELHFRIAKGMLANVCYKEGVSPGGIDNHWVSAMGPAVRVFRTGA